jgi:SAM-dependent methyltransferase
MAYSDVQSGTSWRFACPICRYGLRPGATEAHCITCNRVFTYSSGIWRFLPEERLRPYEQFLREYRIIRQDQGWGQLDAAYFLDLPTVPPNDPQRAIWQRRRRSYGTLLRRIILPTEARLGGPLRIIDVGTGNCWLAHRLTKLGHRVVAVDVSTDVRDGLGAYTWYLSERAAEANTRFTPVQAEFDHIPLLAREVDVAVFNASFHYSTNYTATLREALRVLTSEGVLVIMDSPVYRHADSGEQMVSAREQEFERTYGFRSDSLPAEHFLTTDRLEELAGDLALRWQVYGRAGSLSHAIRPWRKLRRLRELAQMPLIVGYRA